MRVRAVLRPANPNFSPVISEEHEPVQTLTKNNEFLQVVLTAEPAFAAPNSAASNPPSPDSIVVLIIAIMSVEGGMSHGGHKSSIRQWIRRHHGYNCKDNN